jgi:CheY-like chemotaxis protein
MDISLPGISGIEATRRILATEPGTTVVLLSTYAVDDLPADATECGVAAYLHKEDLTPARLRALTPPDDAPAAWARRPGRPFVISVASPGRARSVTGRSPVADRPRSAGRARPDWGDRPGLVAERAVRSRIRAVVRDIARTGGAPRACGIKPTGGTPVGMRDPVVGTFASDPAGKPAGRRSHTLRALPECRNERRRRPWPFPS